MKSETFSLSIGLSCSLSSTTKDSMVAMLLGQEVDNTSVVVESYLPSKHDTISPPKKTTNHGCAQVREQTQFIRFMHLFYLSNQNNNHL